MYGQVDGLFEFEKAKYGRHEFFFPFTIEDIKISEDGLGVGGCGQCSDGWRIRNEDQVLLKTVAE